MTNSLIIEKINNCKFHGALYNSEQELVKSIVKDFELDVLMEADEYFGVNRYHTTRRFFEEE